MNIFVIDGQGGGIGKTIIEKLKAKVPEQFILALGTHSIATAAMIKAGASAGATGENAIVYNCRRSSPEDIIVGAIGIVCANSMHGELTENMALAVSDCAAKKVLVPFNKCNYYIAGLENESLQYQIDCAVEHIIELLK